MRRGAPGGWIQAKGKPRSWPYTCGIKDTDGTHVLVRRADLGAEDVEAFIRTVEVELARAGRARQGPPVVVVHAPEAPREGPSAPVRVEVMLPVNPGTPPPEGFEAATLAPQAVAYTVHHGRADTLGGAEAVLAEWVKMKSLRLGGEVRRIYLKRGKNPRKDVTEVQIPLSR